MSQKRLVLGGGCFWCTEAVYLNVKGVSSVVSGYTGGARANPTYENICTGATGHAEVVDIKYDSELISLSNLLDVFFEIHDPTTLNAQGGDRGTQYRSVIYYDSEEMQKELFDYVKNIQNHFSSPIVTELSELGDVYPAEPYHQDYYRLNSSQGYCMAVIEPKLQKFMTKYPQHLA